MIRILIAAFATAAIALLLAGCGHCAPEGATRCEGSSVVECAGSSWRGVRDCARAIPPSTCRPADDAGPAWCAP